MKWTLSVSMGPSHIIVGRPGFHVQRGRLVEFPTRYHIHTNGVEAVVKQLAIREWPWVPARFIGGKFGIRYSKSVYSEDLCYQQRFQYEGLSEGELVTGISAANMGIKTLRTVRGRVVDWSGNPVVGAGVIRREPAGTAPDSPDSPRDESITDTQGYYCFPPTTQPVIDLTIYAANYYISRAQLELRDPLPDIKLQSSGLPGSFQLESVEPLVQSRRALGILRSLSDSTLHRWLVLDGRSTNAMFTIPFTNLPLGRYELRLVGWDGMLSTDKVSMDGEVPFITRAGKKTCYGAVTICTDAVRETAISFGPVGSVFGTVVRKGSSEANAIVGYCPIDALVSWSVWAADHQPLFGECVVPDIGIRVDTALRPGWGSEWFFRAAIHKRSPSDATGWEGWNMATAGAKVGLFGAQPIGGIKVYEDKELLGTSDETGRLVLALDHMPSCLVVESNNWRVSDIERLHANSGIIGQMVCWLEPMAVVP